MAAQTFSSAEGSDLDVETFAPPFHRAEGEPKRHLLKRMLTEGHSIPDAFLTVAAAQVIATTRVRL